MDKLNILFAASEATPFVKVGGLGDVAGSLPKALLTIDNAPDIRVVLPFHQVIDKRKYKLNPIAAFTVFHAGIPLNAEVFETEVNGVVVYLIGGGPIGEASQVYSSDAYADGVKYTFFSLALLELPKVLGWAIDVLHVNDWHTAAALYALAVRRGRESFLDGVATLLTVHNLPYLGVGTQAALEEFGLPPATESNLPEWAQQMPLPVGLDAADRINMVSEGYAEEVLTEEFGSGLDGYLKGQQKKLSGILNGLDVGSWNPETDEALTQVFGLKTLAKERHKNKAALLDELNFSGGEKIPLLSIISRMDYQKGIDTAMEALNALGENTEWRAVILGTGTPENEDQARALAQRFPDRVRAILRFDGSLARRIYAGADMILIPSRYEPCGLTQMIGMRYGCVPVARATGGLKDTISDFDPRFSKGTGFLYQEDSAQVLGYAIKRALDVFKDQRRWRGIQRRGMKQNFSWQNSAERYLALYQELVKNHG